MEIARARIAAVFEEGTSTPFHDFPERMKPDLLHVQDWNGRYRAANVLPFVVDERLTPAIAMLAAALGKVRGTPHGDWGKTIVEMTPPQVLPEEFTMGANDVERNGTLSFVGPDDRVFAEMKFRSVDPESMSFWSQMRNAAQRLVGRE